MIDRKANPAKWWAAIGAGCLGVWIFTWMGWIVSGNFEPTPSRPTPIPHYMRVSIAIETVAALVLLGVCLYFSLWRPLRRDHRLSLDGVLCIALLSCFWQDPLSNAIRVGQVYNTGFIQFGSWANFLPGWVVPNGQRFSEPLYWEWSLYVVFCLPPMILCNLLMRKAKERWPQIGVVGLIMVAFVAVCIVDVALEVPFLLQGLYAFPGAIRWLTLFHGHYYQFPIYEALLSGVFLGGWASVRYFTDDKGRCIAERGLDRIHGSDRRKGVVRVLAVCGLFNAIFFLGYNLPMGLINGLYADTWPKDIAERSYFTQGMCGPDTGYACPSVAVPIPHKNSAHVNSYGELVVPPGTDAPPFGRRP